MLRPRLHLQLKKTALLSLFILSATACPFGGSGGDSGGSTNLLLSLLGLSGVPGSTAPTPDTVIAPEFSPTPGNYSSTQWVSLITWTPEATILYTNNGTDPACPSSGTPYTAPIKLSSTTTLKAIACKDGMVASSVQIGDYTIEGTVATPTFSIPTGVYTSNLSLNLSLTTPESEIRFTTNGSDPDCATGTLYATPISLTLPGTHTVKAIGCRTGWTPSSIVSATYEQPSTAPQIISITPSVGTFIKADQSVVITFSEGMTSASVSGSMKADEPSILLSKSRVTGDTMTIVPPSPWNVGLDKQLILEAYDGDGNGPYTFSFTYSVSLGKVYYVKKTGSDYSNGLTPATAKATITSASYGASSGDTVLVAEGVYNVDSSSYYSNGAVVLKRGVSVFGGYSNDFTTRSIQSHETKIVDSCISAYSCTAAVLTNNMNDPTVFDGFVVQGAANSNAKAIFDSSSTRLHISNCRIFAGNRSKIAVQLNASMAVLTNNIIFASQADAATSTAVSITGTGGNPILRNNLVHGGSPTGSDGLAMPSGLSAGISMTSGTKATIQNNTINGGSGSLVAMALSPEGESIIENNILFTDNPVKGYCIWYIGSTAMPASLKNNVFRSCATYFSQGSNSFTSMCSGIPGKTDCSVTVDPSVAADNVAADPMFVDEGGKDWRLTTGTPCSISAGGKNLLSDIPRDYSGVSRTVPFSIGAYEQDNSCP